MKMAVESMKMASGGNSRPGRVPEQRFLSPETCLRWQRSYGTFRGWRPILLGFSHRGKYIGERAMSVGARGAHTMSRRDQGGPCLDLVWLLWASNLADFLDPAVFQGFRTMGIFSEFSENFDF